MAEIFGHSKDEVEISVTEDSVSLKVKGERRQEKKKDRGESYLYLPEDDLFAGADPP